MSLSFSRYSAAARTLRVLPLLGVLMFPLALPLGVARAQTSPIGSIISYQGQLSDNAGKPVVNGTQSLTFKIYEEGAEVSSQTMSVATIGGVFNTFLTLGAVTFDPAKSYELGITYGGAESKHPIAAVPVAAKAASASTADSATTAENVSGIVAIANGGTGSATQPFVDLTTGQTVAGVKTFSSQLKGTGGLFLDGTTGDTPASGAGTRMMWIPSKAAFRAGKVDDTQWDAANIGQSSVALGENSRASGQNSVALGEGGTSTAQRALAFNGIASGVGAIALGSGAQANSDDALALGPSAIANGLASVVIGPSQASGAFGVAIGLQNKASGNFSVAIGKNADTDNRQGAIVISDGSAMFSSDKVTATANNQISMRGAGGIRLFTNMQCTSGVEIAPGSGSWSSVSDRNAKENFAPVNSREVLDKVLQLPISTWNYKTQQPGIRHMGAMAQDFHAAFNLGEDEKRIATIDPDGVAFAAIQGLNAELKDRDAKIQALEARLEKLEAKQ